MWLNLGIIAGVVVLAPSYGAVALAVGVLIGTLALIAHEFLHRRKALWEVITASSANGGPWLRAMLPLVLLISAQAIAGKGTVFVKRTIGIGLPERMCSPFTY